ncbi:tubulin-specific chaperone [Angomonas deanei]|nr:tubulin-specific chaperone [Angomonas deanei]|eukprot:EPY39543.1 tubulin-specific chaperone [Angomonas deanei]
MSAVVKLTLTHSISPLVVPEKRYALSQTIESIKENIYTHFATPPDHMRLELYNEYDAKVNNDLQNEKQLGFYGCKDDFRIHVVDLQPAAKQENYTDVSKVQKFELSEEEWLKRGDNLRAFKKR